MSRILKNKYPLGSYKHQVKPGIHLDKWVKQNVDLVKYSVMHENRDAVFIVDGRVGEGKTTFATQLAMYLDPTFNLSRVVFTPDEFAEVILNAKKGQAVVFDEAMIISGRNAMSKYNKKIVRIMTQVRSRNLFIFFILPSVFDLDGNIVLWRANFLFHCESKSFGKRGMYKVWFGDKIKKLWIKGKKYYEYHKPVENIRARFTNIFTLDVNEYEEKKQNSIKAMELKEEKKTPNSKHERVKKSLHFLVYWLMKQENYKITTLAEVTHLSPRQVWRYYAGKQRP